MPHFRIKAVTDVDAERRDAMAERLAATPCDDLAALLADPQVRIVAIATPPHLHGSQGLKAGQARKHILMAEPLATKIGLADVLVRGMERERQRLLVHYPLRAAPAFHLLRVLIQSEVVGPPLNFRVERHVRAAGRPDWFADDERSGGFLVERGAQYFDLAAWVLGAGPTQVAGVPHTAADGSIDGALLNLQYSSGVVASFYYNWQRDVPEDRQVVRVEFELGSAVAHGAIPDAVDLEGIPEAPAQQLAAALGGTVAVDGARLRIQLPPRSEVDALRTLLNALARAILKPDADLPVSPDAALDSLRVALKAQAALVHRKLIEY